LSKKIKRTKAVGHCAHAGSKDVHCPGAADSWPSAAPGFIGPSKKGVVSWTGSKKRPRPNRFQINLADVLVLNKIDLAPAELAAQAKEHGENLFPQTTGGCN
jgi:hypothetical protein